MRRISTLRMSAIQTEIYSIGDNMTNKTESSNAAHINFDSYIALLKEVKVATQALVDLREAEIEEWKADETARLADLEDYVQKRFGDAYYHEYSEYLLSLEPKPLTRWQRLIRIKPGQRKVSEFENQRAFVIARLEEEGRTYKDFYNDTLHITEGEAPWETVHRVIRGYHGATTNDWKPSLDIANAELDGIIRGGDASFTLPRERYDAYTKRLLLADTGKLPKPYTRESSFYSYWD